MYDHCLSDTKADGVDTSQKIERYDRLSQDTAVPSRLPSSPHKKDTIAAVMYTEYPQVLTHLASSETAPLADMVTIAERVLKPRQ